MANLPNIFQMLLVLEKRPLNGCLYSSHSSVITLRDDDRIKCWCTYITTILEVLTELR